MEAKLDKFILETRDGMQKMANTLSAILNNQRLLFENHHALESKLADLAMKFLNQEELTSRLTQL